jgi:N-acyl-D-aspartate/D-glutamate deacylase
MVPGVLSFEQAVSRLTMQPAVLHGLWDRGMLRPGAYADLNVLDPQELAVEPIRFVRDFPTGASRLIFGARGYHQMVVNGELVMDGGKHTGALPGRTLRFNGA